MKLALIVVASVGVHEAVAHGFVHLKPYPGYSGDLVVTGMVGAWITNENARVFWNLHGLEKENCKSVPEGVANACGIHIHTGMDCTDAASVGGHHYDAALASDPWAPISYASFGDGVSSGHARDINIGKVNIAGRALVVHDSTGARVACGELPASLFSPPSSTKRISVDLKPYPGYTGDLAVKGLAGAWLSGYAGGDLAGVWWALTGLETENCKTVPEGVGNACGIHIHTGMDCTDATSIGGHYFDADTVESDPWAPISYNSYFSGTSAGHVDGINIGYRGQGIEGRALVVHDSTGARVACGEIPATFFTMV